jgi:hypothetical protein
VAASLVRRGYAVRLVTDTGAATVASAAHSPRRRGLGLEGLLLDALAVIPSSSGSTLRDVAPLLRRGGDGLLVAILGAVDLDQAAELARLAHATTAVALVLDVAAWTPGVRYPERGATAGEQGAMLLQRSGWRVVRVRAGDSVATIWPQVARHSSFSAGGVA